MIKKLGILTFISTAALATTIGLNVGINKDAMLANAEQTKKVTRPEHISITLQKASSEDYASINNARFHIFNIQTIFDNPNNRQYNLDAQGLANPNMQRVYFYDGSNKCANTGAFVYCWKDDGSNDWNWPGHSMKRVSNTNYYYYDIDPNYTNFKFNNGNGNEFESNNLKINDIKDSKHVLYDQNNGGFVLNRIDMMEDKNSRYFYEAVHNTYTINAPSENDPSSYAGRLYDKVRPYKVVDKKLEENNLDTVFNKQIHFPWYVTGMDIDVIANRTDGYNAFKVVQFKNPFHLDAGKSYRLTLNKNGEDPNYEGQYEKVKGTLTVLSESNPATDLDAYDKFLIKYANVIKHNDSDSICDGLKDTSNQTLIKEMLDKYYALPSYYKALAEKSLDKVDSRDLSEISIAQTVSYIAEYSNYSSKNILKTNLKNVYKNNSIIVITSLSILSISLLSLFIYLNKKISKNK